MASYKIGLEVSYSYLMEGSVLNLRAYYEYYALAIHEDTAHSYGAEQALTKAVSLVLVCSLLSGL